MPIVLNPSLMFMMLALPHLCRWNLHLHKSRLNCRFSFYSIGHFKRTTIINTFGPYNGSKMMPWDSLHLLNMIMCQLGRAGCNDPGSSPQFAQSCQLLQDSGWRGERVHNLVTILRGGQVVRRRGSEGKARLWPPISSGSPSTHLLSSGGGVV